ncbi:MAG TPA: MliC family protein [Gammaproteobacteria bacterium]|nr:MliC family protein [Gammaproteobacteria bacterium]
MWPRILIVAGLFVIAAVVAVWLMSDGGGGSAPPPQRIAAARFLCDGDKRIDATFYASAAKPAPSRGRPAPPGGSVHVELSDGREADLPQTVSADGARYADADESLVFWNRGNGAFVIENREQTYTDCIAVAPDPGGLPGEYAGSIDTAAAPSADDSGARASGGGAPGADARARPPARDARVRFSIRYPAGYAVDAAYAYEALGPGKAIRGVKLTIPPSLAAGTNLGADTYLSVEAVPRGDSCSADRFLGAGSGAAAVTEGGTTYSVAKAAGAGAGNRYEETVYALLGTDPCTAVRYFVHYAVMENYPPGAVREFDRQALIAQFDAIRRTMTVLR